MDTERKGAVMNSESTTAQKIAALNVQIAFIQASDAKRRADEKLDRAEGEGRR
jgi:hypothetical protein